MQLLIKNRRHLIIIALVALTMVNTASGQAMWQISTTRNHTTNGRISAGFGNVRWLSRRLPMQVEVASISVIKAERTYISSNSLLCACGLLPPILYKTVTGKELSFLGIAGAFMALAPNTIGNFKIIFPVIDQISITAGQRTDYYLFYKVSRVCPASTAGLGFSLGQYRANVEVVVPWTTGYLPDRYPRFAVGIGYAFEHY